MGEVVWKTGSPWGIIAATRVTDDRPGAENAAAAPSQGDLRPERTA